MHQREPIWVAKPEAIGGDVSAFAASAGLFLSDRRINLPQHPRFASGASSLDFKFRASFVADTALNPPF
jgi:hypothetical protein